MQWQKYFLTFLGIGLSSNHPQIVAKIAALALGTLILESMGAQTLFMGILAITVIGIFEINKYEHQTGKLNHPEIVIDEVAGVWLSLLIAYSSASTISDRYLLWLAIPLSLASFWFFATWKPSTIGWLHQNLRGGVGAMGDDILAGFAGGFLSVLILLGIGKL